MLVPGVIAAIWAAMVINAPADAALEPLGETYTTIGILEAIISFIIILIDVSSPPGVSSCMIKTSALLTDASFIPLIIYSAETGFITPSTFKNLVCRLLLEKKIN